MAALPIMVPVSLVTAPSAWAPVPPTAWIGLVYVSVFSMLIGFMFWYRGLALGGIAAVGQLQLLQPFFGLIIAATLLHELVDPAVISVVAAVVLCVAGAKRFADRSRRQSTGGNDAGHIGPLNRLQPNVQS